MENWDFPYIGSGESGICRDVNVDLENKFLRLLKEQKRKHIGGRNHVCKSSQRCLKGKRLTLECNSADLSLLATSPAYQGRGCGTMLLQWGLQEATRRGLDCFLQCTPSSHQFYLNAGFRDVSFFDMKIEAETNKNNDEMTNYRTILMKKVCT